jgi:hypothetical protein
LEVTGDRAGEPLWVVEGAGKIRSGLYIRAIAAYEDGIVFEVFASRPLGAEDLEDLVLADDVGTTYELGLPESGVLKGKTRLEFRPALPAGASTLHLSQPGWGLHVWGMSD